MSETRNKQRNAAGVWPLSDEQLDDIAERHTWYDCDSPRLDHRRFAREVLAAIGVQETAPAEPWQNRVAQRFAFDSGVSAMRGRAILVIEARHESGWDCSPTALVKAVRDAADPANPYDVPASAPASNIPDPRLGAPKPPGHRPVA